MLNRILILSTTLFLCSCYVCNYDFYSDVLIDKSIKVNQDEALRFSVDVDSHSQADKLHLFLMPLYNFEIVDISVKFDSLDVDLEQVGRCVDYNYLYTCPDFKKVIEASDYLQLKVIIKDKTTSKIQTKEYKLYKEKKCNFLFVLH